MKLEARIEGMLEKINSDIQELEGKKAILQQLLSEEEARGEPTKKIVKVKRTISEERLKADAPTRTFKKRKNAKITQEEILEKLQKASKNKMISSTDWRRAVNAGRSDKNQVDPHRMSVVICQLMKKHEIEKTRVVGAARRQYLYRYAG